MVVKSWSYPLTANEVRINNREKRVCLCWNIICDAHKQMLRQHLIVQYFKPIKAICFTVYFGCFHALLPFSKQSFHNYNSHSAQSFFCLVHSLLHRAADLILLILAALLHCSLSAHFRTRDKRKAAGAVSLQGLSPRMRMCSIYTL